MSDSQISEILDNKLKLVALSKNGIWLPFAEIQITKETSKSFRIPLLVKIDDSLDEWGKEGL